MTRTGTVKRWLLAGLAFALSSAAVAQPVVGTAPTNDNTARAASTQFVTGAISAAQAASNAFATTSIAASAGSLTTTFNSGLALKAPLASPTFTGTATIPILALSGSGSTGDVSGMSVKPNGLTVARTFANRFADIPLNVNDFLPGTDATGAVQAAINAGLAQNRPVRCDGQYSVSHVVVAAGGLRLQGSCNLIGNATTATSSVLEVQAGVLFTEGSLNVSGNYNTNYDTAFLWKNSTQYSQITNLSASAAKTCFTIGSTDNPSALMSEVTIIGGHTYGCTQIMKVIGVEAVVHVIGQQWSSDAFGAPSTNWAGVPFRGIIAIGSDVTVTGGELVMTAITTGALLENQPLTGANTTTEGTYYGRIRLFGTTTETASPLAVTSNPSNLTIAPLQNQRGLFQFGGLNGFHSQNAAPFITTGADFDGEVIWSNGRMYFPGTRTQPNISAGSAKTDVYVDDSSFGPGFRDSVAGTVGGTIHFGSRQILAANGLAAQSVPSGTTTLKFTGVDNGGGRGRFTTAYSATTGVFTVPPGGLKELHIDASVVLGGTGTLYVNRNDGSGVYQHAGMPYANGAAAISYDAYDVPAGTQLSLLVGTSTATTAGAPDYFNTFRIRARN